MAKKTRIEQDLFQCQSCKEKFFSYLKKDYCTECSKEYEEDKPSEEDYIDSPK